jgi:alpha-L-rhamnosidase
MTKALLPIALCTLGTACAVTGSSSGLQPARLRAEYRTEPLGIDAAAPRLSWVAVAADPAGSGRDQRQSAYQIVAASTPELLARGQGDLWDSGKVASPDAVHVPWRGGALRPGQRVYWGVRVWDRDGRASPPSAPTWFEVGLLGDQGWKASWIEDTREPPRSDDEMYQMRPSPMFRKEFTLAKKVARARAYVSGLGYYELYLNGRRVGDHELDPGWTTYSKRVLYSSYDVTELVKTGANAVGVVVGNGWWNPLPFKMFRKFNFREALPIGAPRAIVQLETTYEDGSVERVVSDASWKAGDSGVLRNNIYLGELYDARRHPAGWDRAGFDDSGWRPVRVATDPVGPLVAQEAPPIRVTRRLRPVAVTEPRPGMFVFDMGQNFAGRVSLRVRGPAGTRVAMRFAELLYRDGTPNGMTTFAGQLKTRTDEDRVATPPETPVMPKTAWQQDVYYLAGTGDEVYTPHFTFHGFRYVAVEGYPGRPTLDALEGQRMNSDVESAGTFSSSNPLFAKIQEAVHWTFLSNVFSVESDCPQRERLGYGGDIVAADETAMLNWDMGRFYAKAARDFTDAARANGGFTETAPYVGIEDRGYGDGTGPIGWGVAHPVLLRDLLVYYGDRDLVEEQYGALTRYLDFLAAKIPDHVTDRDIPDHEALVPRSAALTATALYHQAATIAAELAQRLGKADDERRYAELAGRIAAAFNDKFLEVGSGRYDDGSQTAQAYALYHGLVPQEQRAAAFARLVDAVDKREGHLSTGIFATKYLLEVLPTRGRPDLAGRIANQRTFPGWGYMLDNGATTIWESWAKNEVSPSHNHPMFGSVSEWFYKHVAGIAPAPDAVGFDRIVLRPQPASDLRVEWAKGRYESVRGPVVSEWRRDASGFAWDVSVPVGAVATAYVPAAKAADVQESGAPAASAAGVKLLREEAGAVVLELRPGRYSFAAR